jgi:PKD repeat protein
MKKVYLACAALLFGAAAAAQTVFTDETAYLAALAAGGYSTITEGFEGVAWDGVRTVVNGPVNITLSVTSSGITWSANEGITTSDLFPVEGSWRVLDYAGGDPDTLYGTSAATLYGVGGWFTTTSFTTVRIVIDGVEPDGANMVITSGWSFLGVIAPAGFSSFEIRDSDATPLDPKEWFADAFTLGAAGPGPNSPPNGTITSPATDVTIEAGQSVSFAGSATDPDADAVTVLWDFGDGSGSVLLVPGSHSFASAGIYTVTFTVTDSHAASDPTPDSRTITVSNPPAPDIETYLPAGWSDRIVVSTDVGTNQDSAILKPVDLLFLDWGAINSGISWAAASQVVDVDLYIDDLYVTTWSWPGDWLANEWLSVQDYGLGSLSTGQHTIRLVTDATNVVAESDETNNEFTKSITVDAATPNCDMVLADLVISATQLFEACNSITAGPNLQIAASGHATFRAAARVVLGNGVSVSSGGTLTVAVDPALAR